MNKNKTYIVADVKFKGIGEKETLMYECDSIEEAKEVLEKILNGADEFVAIANSGKNFRIKC